MMMAQFCCVALLRMDEQLACGHAGCWQRQTRERERKAGGEGRRPEESRVPARALFFLTAFPARQKKLFESIKKGDHRAQACCLRYLFSSLPFDCGWAI